jgi:membrane protease YdiL (CAAX protease family)
LEISHDRQVSMKESFPRRIGSVFWNQNEHRLRVLWRLSVAVLIFFIIALILALASIPFGDVRSDKAGEFQSNIAIIIAIWLTCRFIDRRRFSDTGVYFRKSWWIDFGFGLLLGMVLMTAIFLVEWGLGWVSINETFRTGGPEQSFLTAILITALFFISVGIAEELAFRGYFLLNVAEGFNSRWIKPKAALIISWIFTSVIFGFGHLGNPNATVVSSLNIALAGIFIGFAYVMTGRLAIPIGLHISWNLFQGNVFGFPVSGTTDWSTTFLAVQQGGPEFWTGGAFGPEGGFIGLLGFLTGMAITALWIRFCYGKLTFYTQIANPPQINAEESEVSDLPDNEQESL